MSTAINEFIKPLHLKDGKNIHGQRWEEIFKPDKPKKKPKATK